MKPQPYWLPKEMLDMYDAASPEARRFIEELAPTQYQSYHTTNYNHYPNSHRINRAYATLILDQLASEFGFRPIFRFETHELSGRQFKFTPGQPQVYMMSHDNYFFIQISTDKCRPLYICFGDALSHMSFISGEWTRNIDKIKQELRMQALIKIVET